MARLKRGAKDRVLDLYRIPVHPRLLRCEHFSEVENRHARDVRRPQVGRPVVHRTTREDISPIVTVLGYATGPHKVTQSDLT